MQRQVVRVQRTAVVVAKPDMNHGWMSYLALSVVFAILTIVLSSL